MGLRTEHRASGALIFCLAAMSGCAVELDGVGPSPAHRAVPLPLREDNDGGSVVANLLEPYDETSSLFGDPSELPPIQSSYLL